MKLAMPAHYFRKFERCFYSYQRPDRLFFSKKIHKCTYQEREKDPETGKEAFQLRLWDARIGRWLAMDPYGQFSSPYLGMGNNPMNGVDPDGGEWRPDEDGNLVAEFGDNASTLATYLGISKTDAQKMINDQGLLVDYTNGTGYDLAEHQVLKLDDLSNNPNYEYGFPRGLNGTSGFYNRN